MTVNLPGDIDRIFNQITDHVMPSNLGSFSPRTFDTRQGAFSFDCGFMQSPLHTRTLRLAARFRILKESAMTNNRTLIASPGIRLEVIRGVFFCTFLVADFLLLY
jgi:hypothetical protein